MYKIKYIFKYVYIEMQSVEKDMTCKLCRYVVGPMLSRFGFFFFENMPNIRFVKSDFFFRFRYGMDRFRWKEFFLRFLCKIF